MKIIYADEMFLLNLVINYFILLATAKFCALPLKRLRFGASAALGGLYSVMTLFPALGFLDSPLMKLCLGAAMSLIAFGGSGRLLRSFLAFLCVSAAFGGAVFAASLLAGAEPGGGYYINASARVLLLSFAICYAVMTLIFNRLGRRAGRETMEVSMTLNGRKAELVALKDTGNELYDPLSGLPVMVISPEAAERLLPSPVRPGLSRGAADFLQAVGEDEALRSRFRLIPYSTAGISHGLLPVFKPDQLTVNGKPRDDILAGISPTPISSDGEFSAIF